MIKERRLADAGFAAQHQGTILTPANGVEQPVEGWDSLCRPSKPRRGKPVGMGDGSLEQATTLRTPNLLRLGSPRQFASIFCAPDQRCVPVLHSGGGARGESSLP
jgi:hypothetical protein